MATASMQPELKGVVIISLPPPDHPNEGKTVCAAFTVRGGGGGGSVQQQQQRQQQPQQQQQIPNPNPRRPFLSRRRARLRKATAILFVSAVALAIWYWTPYSGFDGRPNEDDDDSKVGVYTLYPKYGNNYHGPVEDKPAMKLGAFVERDTTRNNVPPATSTSSSTAFTIQGNVYPDGLYYVSMLIGNPPKAYHLDVDTGSDLTWIQCDAPCRSCAKGPHALYKPKKSQLVSCMEPMCANVQAGHSYECTSTSEQCDYEIEYADHGSSMGVLARDNIRVLLTNGSIARTNFVFGCAYDQQGSLAVSPAVTDGVLGLSGAQVSLPSQLASQGLSKNVIGHCIAGDERYERDERGGGYMFFGNDLVPVWGMTWVPMLGKPAMKLYYVGNANMKLGNRPLVADDLKNKLGGVVFDSGSSFTYLTETAYFAFVSAVKENLFGGGLVQDLSDTTLPLCWRARHPIRSIADVKPFFKPLTLDFGGSPWLIKTKQFDIPPEGYLVISSQNNVCLGILNGSGVNNGATNIIGDISLQGHLIVYDNAKNQIGWAHADCHKPPNKIKAFPFFV